MSTADGRSRPTNGSADTKKLRRYFVGGSDARIIMGNDEAALLRLWQEKRGEIGPQDLSSNLVVQLGLATEDLNRRCYESNTGQRGDRPRGSGQALKVRCCQLRLP